MMLLRPLLLAAALIAAIPVPALAGANDAVLTPDWKSDSAAIAVPVLRAIVTVTGDVVRIGDVIDNAGSFGQIGLTRFINKGGLQPVGSNQYTDTPSSGPPQDGVANAEGYGNITQGSLEQSNVDVVSEMSNLITAQRAYEMNSKVISAADQMMQTTTALFR